MHFYYLLFVCELSTDILMLSTELTRALDGVWLKMLNPEDCRVGLFLVLSISTRWRYRMLTHTHTHIYIYILYAMQ